MNSNPFSRSISPGKSSTCRGFHLLTQRAPSLSPWQEAREFVGFRYGVRASAILVPSSLSRRIRRQGERSDTGQGQGAPHGEEAKGGPALRGAAARHRYRGGLRRARHQRDLGECHRRDGGNGGGELLRYALHRDPPVPTRREQDGSTASVLLVPGANRIRVTARDLDGNWGVRRDRPMVPARARGRVREHRQNPSRLSEIRSHSRWRELQRRRRA